MARAKMATVHHVMRCSMLNTLNPPTQPVPPTREFVIYTTTLFQLNKFQRVGGRRIKQQRAITTCLFLVFVNARKVREI